MNNTPQLRFPGKNMSWDNKVLGEVIDVIKGQQVNNSELTSDSTKFPMLNGGSSISGYYIKYNTPANSITISEGGNSCGFVNCMKMDFWAGGHCYIVKPLIDINNEFLFQVLKYMEPEIMKLRVGSGLPNIQRKSLLNEINLDIPTDPAEQQKIAECLSALDDLISAQGEKVDALKTRKKGLMQQLFPQNGETTPRLRFPSFTGEWSERKFSDIFDRLTEKNEENNKNVLTISAQFGLISQLEFFKKSVAAADVTGYYLLHKGDFAYNKSSSQGRPVGAIKPLKMSDKGVVSTLYICFRCKDEKAIGFWEQYFDAGIFDKEIMSIAQEGARNHGLLNVPTGDFFGLSVLSPTNPSEQQKIASCLSALDDLIASESAELEALKAHKKGLMQQLFPEPAK